jgi:hypothetical protein
MAEYHGEASPETKDAMVTKPEPRPERKLTLPYDPIDSAMKSPEHARRAIQGILESYSSNYDALSEAIQNSMDALEDACINKLPGLAPSFERNG